MIPASPQALHGTGHGDVPVPGAVGPLVNTPCVATVAVLARELGWRWALTISAFTIVLALIVGGLARHLGALW